MSDDKIKLLQELVNSAQKEYAIASACHEVWRPAAFDTALHSRMEKTYAGNAFATIRGALRRETLLALMRLWDNDKKAVSVSKISTILQEPEVIEALVADRKANWERPSKFGEEQGKFLREQISDIVSLIALYEKGGEYHGTMLHLKSLRNQQLAHKQLISLPSGADPIDTNDQAVERLYTRMRQLVSMLKVAVLDTDFRPEQSIDIYRRHAKLFWDGVRGETTEGHPSYQSLFE